MDKENRKRCARVIDGLSRIASWIEDMPEEDNYIELSLSEMYDLLFEAMEIIEEYMGENNDG